MLLSLALLATASAPFVQDFNVDGVARQALVFPGQGPGPHPLVLAFHGHSGNMRQASRSFGLQDLWPQATIIYPQGLPTKGMTDPEGKYNGWQQKPEDEGGRDIKFTDEILAWVKDVDRRHVYAMGHSNGGRFTYVLWATRGNVFTAYGPSSSPGIGLVRQMKPASAFCVAGQSDPIVPFVSQQLTIRQLERLNGVDLSKGTKQGYVTLANGKSGIELGTYIHPGGHVFPQEAAAAMVALFKRH